MTGNPILRLLLLIVALGSLGLAIGQLTAPRSLATPEEPVVPIASDQISVVMIFDSPLTPSSVRISTSGKLLIDVVPKSGSLEVPFTLPASRRGMDLVVEAKWPSSSAGAVNALRVRLNRDDLPLQDVTLWGEPDVADVVTLPSEEPTP